MNTIITFELAKLLKEKGFDTPTIKCYAEERLINKNTGGDLFTGVFRLCTKSKFHKKYYYAPTIAEVVMWLYEKHGIWIYSHKDGGWWFPVIENYYDEDEQGTIIEDLSKMSRCYFDSPTESYEAAIDYILNNLI